jgi:hypothetical protein
MGTVIPCLRHRIQRRERASPVSACSRLLCRFACILRFVIPRQTFALRRQSHERRIGIDLGGGGPPEKIRLTRPPERGGASVWLNFDFGPSYARNSFRLREAEPITLDRDANRSGSDEQMFGEK